MFCNSSGFPFSLTEPNHRGSPEYQVEFGSNQFRGADSPDCGRRWTWRITYRWSQHLFRFIDGLILPSQFKVMGMPLSSSIRSLVVGEGICTIIVVLRGEFHVSYSLPTSRTAPCSPRERINRGVGCYLVDLLY